MATNLIALAMEFLTPDMIGRIASALSLNRNSAQTAITAAVPELLAGLSGVAARHGGAQKLVDAAKQQTSTLRSRPCVAQSGCARHHVHANLASATFDAN